MRREGHALLVGVALLLAASPLSGAGEAAAPVAAQNECLGSSDWPAVEKACATLTKAEPANGRAWFRLGLARQQQKNYKGAVDAYVKAEAIGHHPTVMMNLAGSYAKLGDTENALKWVESAASAGFSDPAAVRADEDLAPLKGIPRFEAAMVNIEAASRPCASLPEARQFDFWIGKWEVHTPQGQLAGKNEIQLILGDCVLLENWTSQRGSSGKSINVYNPYKKKWQQTWVDDRGDVTEFVDGEYQDGVMRFRAETRNRDGSALLRRLSFTNLGPGKVRQYSEQSSDGGKTWNTEYDLTYTRVGEASAQQGSSSGR